LLIKVDKKHLDRLFKVLLYMAHFSKYYSRMHSCCAHSILNTTILRILCETVCIMQHCLHCY